MSAHCCEHETPKPAQIANLTRYRRVLWIALAVNAAMFAVELSAGFTSGSLSLIADAIDFAGDACFTVCDFNFRSKSRLRPAQKR